MQISRRSISNAQSMRQHFESSTRPSRINQKPFNRPMTMDWEETSRYSSTPVNKIHFKLKFSVYCIFDYIIGNEKTEHRRKCNVQS
jgi:ribosomal protein S26